MEDSKTQQQIYGRRMVGGSVVSYFLVLSIYPTAIACHHYLTLIKVWIRPVVVLSFFTVVSLLPNAYSRVSPFKLMTSFPLRAQATVDWISQNTTTEARVMVEEIDDAGRPDNPYGGSYLNAFLPSLTGREIIGGPYPGIDILYHRVTFIDGVLLSKSVLNMNDDELAGILKLYNIGWVICFSPEAKSRFNRVSSMLDHSQDMGPLSFYNVRLGRSFFLIGDGEVQASPGLIRVRVKKSENNSVVIKYHWAPHLKIEPSGVIELYDVQGDPIGFIRVLNPPPEFFISG
jgi:hypothetical protein